MNATLFPPSGPFIELCDSEDRDRWLAMRRSGIGASEAAILIGEHSRHTLSWLVAEKRGLLPVDAEAREYLEWGLRHESTMRDAYASPRYAGRAVRPAGKLLRSTDHQWALATLDAWTLHPVHGWIPLELKCTDYARDAWEHGTPPDFWWQVQHQLLVTGAPMASIGCLLGPLRFVWEDVARDEAAIRRLAIHGAEAWRLIGSDEDPPGPYDAATFRALWPSEDGSRIELDERFAVLDEERESIAAAKKAAEKRLDEINDELRAAIKGAAEGVLPGGRVRYSLKEVTRKEHVVKATTYRQLRRIEAKER